MSSSRCRFIQTFCASPSLQNVPSMPGRNARGRDKTTPCLRMRNPKLRSCLPSERTQPVLSRDQKCLLGYYLTTCSTENTYASSFVIYVHFNPICFIFLGMLYSPIAWQCLYDLQIYTGGSIAVRSLMLSWRSNKNLLGNLLTYYRAPVFLKAASGDQTPCEGGSTAYPVSIFLQL